VKSPSQRTRILPGTRGAFTGFRDSFARWASWCTRELPGGLRRTRRHVSCSDGGSERGFGMARSEGGFRAGFQDKCHTPKVFESMFRRSFEGVFRQGFATASKGVSGHAALSEGLRKGVLRCGTSRRWFSKGVSARDVAGWLSKGSSGGVWFRRGFSKAVSKEVAKGSSGRLPKGFRKAFIGGGSGRWIEDLRPGWAG